jgi:hypothetical protein
MADDKGIIRYYLRVKRTEISLDRSIDAKRRRTAAAAALQQFDELIRAADVVGSTAKTSGGTGRSASASSSRRILVWEMRLPASRDSSERVRLTGTHRRRAAPEMGES